MDWNIASIASSVNLIGTRIAWKIGRKLSTRKLTAALTQLSIGIDEISLVKGQGKFIVVLVDLETHKLIGLVPARKQVEIEKVMQQWGEKVLAQIEEVSIDMTGNYLYSGLSLKLPGLSPGANAWLNLMLMCAGIGSPGTLAEVFRGYKGDAKAPQLIDDEEIVRAAPLPPIKGSFFKLAGGKGFQRPFELATLRLRNMAEVLTNDMSNPLSFLKRAN
ncbi:MAG: transposase [Phormidium sp.]